LARLKRQDVDFNSSTLLILDPKGKRTSGARRHYLPMIKSVNELITSIFKSHRKGDYVFSTNGVTAIKLETVSIAVKKILDSMIENRETAYPFQLRDVRRTCETMFAAEGISKEVRAQLQSHGLGGVQDRHYDRHDYMSERRDVLEILEKRLALLT
jgi:integrase